MFRLEHVLQNWELEVGNFQQYLANPKSSKEDKALFTKMNELPEYKELYTKLLKEYMKRCSHKYNMLFVQFRYK